jgi:hypothetical protein
MQAQDQAEQFAGQRILAMDARKQKINQTADERRLPLIRVHLRLSAANSLLSFLKLQ